MHTRLVAVGLAGLFAFAIALSALAQDEEVPSGQAEEPLVSEPVREDVVVVEGSADESEGDGSERDGAEGDGPELVDLESRSSYFFGYQMGESLTRQGLDVELETLVAGIKDALAKKKCRMSQAECQATIEELQTEMQAKNEAAGETNKKAGAEFLAANGKRQGVTTTKSGLQYKVLKSGKGASPRKSDTVTTHYKGTFIDGTTFDSSYDRGEPATFAVDRVIPGWTEALQMMKVGDKWQLYVPSNLAYGPRGRDEIPPNSTLVFEVELLDIAPGEANGPDEDSPKRK